MSRKNYTWYLLAFGLLCSISAFAAAPTITDKGVVNVASYAVVGAPNSGVTPGGLAVAYGSNFTAAAGGVVPGVLPFPQTFDGASVTVAGKAAALFYVFPGQICFQVPWDAPAGQQPVVVTNADGASNAVNVNVVPAAPGVFTLTANGQGSGAVVVYPADHSAPFVMSFKKSAKPGDSVALFLTDLDTVSGTPPALGDAPHGSFPGPAHSVKILVGNNSYTPDFVGLIGVGFWQINWTVPNTLQDDCYHAVTVVDNGVASNSFALSVAGSGDCTTSASGILAPQPGEKYLFGTLSNTAFSSSFGTISSNQFAAFAFQAPSAGSAVSSVRFPANGSCLVYSVADTNGPSTVTSPFGSSLQLDAGKLGLQGPSFGPQTISASTKGTYLFPSLGGQPFTITPGTWTMSGQGGADITAFSGVSINYPGTFAVSTFGAANGVITRAGGTTAKWTCPFTSGGARVVVTVDSDDSAAGVQGFAVCSALCTDNQLTIGSDVLSQLPASSTGAALVFATLTPDFGTFSNTFALDGTHLLFTWTQGLGEFDTLQ